MTAQRGDGDRVFSSVQNDQMAGSGKSVSMMRLSGSCCVMRRQPSARVSASSTRAMRGSACSRTRSPSRKGPGGATMSSANYLMLSTAGQPVSGTAASGNYSLLSGYWYGFQDFVRTILLPAIMGG